MYIYIYNITATVEAFNHIKAAEPNIVKDGLYGDPDSGTDPHGHFLFGYVGNQHGHFTTLVPANVVDHDIELETKC